MANLAGDPACAAALRRRRHLLADKMAAWNDAFEACAWYRDHWTRNRIIRRGAKG
jgi:hypothetical protein